MSALHITNGDCAAARLREFISDPVLAAADVLHDGPAPAVDDGEWYARRAQFLGNFADETASIQDGLAAIDRALDRAAEYDEAVLWFEHDLFDQLNLIRTLDRLARARQASMPGVRVFLICIDRFPGVERFIGLGQLDARQLSTLVASKVRVTDEHYRPAARAWAAFRASDPTGLLEIVGERSPALPYLGDAFQRLLEEYPSVRNGLSTTAQRLVEAADGEPIDAGVLFERTQAREERPFLGDWSVFDIIRRLATARVPLLRVDGDLRKRDLRGEGVSLTDAGRRVAAGEQDAVALNGIDEWRGGVHLLGANSSPWRWDPARKTLVSWNPR